MRKVFGFHSYELKNDEVEMCVTREGGQMAPVVFFPKSGSPVSPYYVNPWRDEERDGSLDVLLQALRGDFFCFPFGGDNTTPSYSFEGHGPTANRKWRFVKKCKRSLRIAMDFPDGKARVETEYLTIPGHSCLYITNTVANCALRLPYGHHCILDCSSPLLISTSPIIFGMVSPESDKPTEGGEYRALAGHGEFKSLKAVPSRLTDQPTFDLTRFPAREGFCDIVQLYNDPASGRIGWSCAVCPEKGYVWFSFKRIEDLPSTTLWMENKGRHGKPWSGRNVCVGIEDTMSFFAAGAKESCQPNLLTERGIPTSRQFSPDKPARIRIIEGVARIPNDFAAVARVETRPEDREAALIDEEGRRAPVLIDLGFLLD